MTTLPSPFTVPAESDTSRPGKAFDLDTNTPVLRYGNVTISIEMVDEDIAGEWLDKHNTHNRHKRDHLSGTYAIDMANGDWLFTGDAIRFADVTTVQDGVEIVEEVMIDGQHRAEGIRKSKTVQPVVVIRHLDIEVQKVVDTGAARRLADILKLELKDMWSNAVGIDVNFLAAIARRTMLFKRGYWATSGGNATLSKMEILQYITDNEATLAPAAKLALRVRDTREGLAPSVICSAYLLCAEVDKAGADLFFGEQVIRGVHIGTLDPAYVLRAKLLRKDVYAPKTADEAFQYTLLAWNQFREDNKIARLQAPRDGWGKASEWNIR